MPKNRNRRSRLFPVVALILVSALAWWLFRERETAPLPDLTDAEESPDAYFEGMVLRSADGDGRWSYQLASPQASHFASDDRWELDEPDWRSYHETGSDWYGRSEHGRAWPDEDRVMLDGAVHMSRPASADNRPLEIVTRNVLIRPSLEYAETDEEVIATQQLSRMRGIGGWLWLAREELELLNEVNGLYDPTSD